MLSVEHKQKRDSELIFSEIFSENYSVRIAQTQKEIESALRLRFEVFNIEMAGETALENSLGIESDDFDFVCYHLIVTERKTKKTVGTYRLNTLETAGTVGGFYSSSEFSIEDLPPEITAQAVEIGRACIAREHRNTKVLFLLWKGLAAYFKQTKKRYLFGCCSVFSTDSVVGMNAYRQLEKNNFIHPSFKVQPREAKVCPLNPKKPNLPVELPMLFNMYLKIGARVCGEPIIDYDFGTIDFFVIFDLDELNPKYRQMFLS